MTEMPPGDPLLVFRSETTTVDPLWVVVGAAVIWFLVRGRRADI